MENDKNKIILVNIVEALVKLKAKGLMKSIEMCRCDKCFMDVCAITLNKFNPKYVTTTRGELLAKISTYDHNYQSEMMVEILKAMLIVKKTPRHD